MHAAALAPSTNVTERSGVPWRPTQGERPTPTSKRTAPHASRCQLGLVTTAPAVGHIASRGCCGGILLPWLGCAWAHLGKRLRSLAIILLIAAVMALALARTAMTKYDAGVNLLVVIFALFAAALAMANQGYRCSLIGCVTKFCSGPCLEQTAWHWPSMQRHAQRAATLLNCHC